MLSGVDLNVLGLTYSFNRTSMELKLAHIPAIVPELIETPFNRTSMELKLSSLISLILGFPYELF